jgi:Mn2+/Fe2+ NRAMP family transporter
MTSAIVPRKLGILGALGPGILVAATGVGAGDIASASFAGSFLGYTILWAAVLGAFIKFVVNEGLTRWQLATGQTLLEGAVLRRGRPVQWFFLAYLLIWSFSVGTSLISACGVAVHALVPVFDSPQSGKIVFGIAQSIIALALVLIGGYKRFEQLMTALLVLMFVTVIATAVMIRPHWRELVGGLLVPRIPTEKGQDGVLWTLAVMGGVGGTLTVLCYGYWIREQGRAGPEFLRLCRIDLGVAYAFTALFGVSMVIIGKGMNLTKGGGEAMMIRLAERLHETLGAPGRILFLLGAWGAVFTSLLGVWQAVPYLFADFWNLWRRGRAVPVDTRSPPYRIYLVAIALVPIVGLHWNFQLVQKANSVFGALVMPMLALALLIMNTRTSWIGERFRNRPVTIVVLIAVLLFFAFAGYLTLKYGTAIVA